MKYYANISYTFFETFFQKKSVVPVHAEAVPPKSVNNKTHKYRIDSRIAVKINNKLITSKKYIIR